LIMIARHLGNDEGWIAAANWTTADFHLRFSAMPQTVAQPLFGCYCKGLQKETMFLKQSPQLGPVIIALQ
jgi:hypothetical protein